MDIVLVINAMTEKISLSRQHLRNDLQEARQAIKYQGNVIHVQIINGNKEACVVCAVKQGRGLDLQVVITHLFSSN